MSQSNNAPNVSFDEEDNTNKPTPSDNTLAPSQDLSQLTVSSQNQLTATSMRSIGSNLDLDECINRLLEVGMSGKISKSVCFRNSEIVAICKAAQEVFMSQPVCSGGMGNEECYTAH